MNSFRKPFISVDSFESKSQYNSQINQNPSSEKFPLEFASPITPEMNSNYKNISPNNLIKLKDLGYFTSRPNHFRVNSKLSFVSISPNHCHIKSSFTPFSLKFQSSRNPDSKSKISCINIFPNMSISNRKNNLEKSTNSKLESNKKRVVNFVEEEATCKGLKNIKKENSNKSSQLVYDIDYYIEASRLIQSFFRMLIFRKEYLRMKKSAIKIQRNYRKYSSFIRLKANLQFKKLKSKFEIFVNILNEIQNLQRVINPNYLCKSDFEDFESMQRTILYLTKIPNRNFKIDNFQCENLSFPRKNNLIEKLKNSLKLKNKENSKLRQKYEDLKLRNRETLIEYISNIRTLKEKISNTNSHRNNFKKR